jgi:hypothetical protein
MTNPRIRTVQFSVPELHSILHAIASVNASEEREGEIDSAEIEKRSWIVQRILTEIVDGAEA